jgi:hypothetical protein
LREPSHRRRGVLPASTDGGEQDRVLDRPHGDPRDDLDLASYGVVKVLEDGRIEPKAAFTALARHYGTP